MAKDWSASLLSVNFRCGECGHAFENAPDLVADAPEQDWHPYRYFAHCPKCEAQHQPQAGWERALLKAHQHSTGPKSKEGIAASAANLTGHPTPEETRRTRFNAMKHGMSARTATYFPAKPGRYSFCSNCDVDRTWCGQQSACVKQTEIFMLHHAAFDRRDPKVLGELHADLAASLTAMLQMAIQEVLGAGVTIEQPRVELDREGTPVTLTYLDGNGERQYIMNRQIHPAIKAVTELVSRLGLSMTDLGMTVRAADDDAEEERGMLKLDDKTRETLSAFNERMQLAMAGAKEMLKRAAEDTAKDPVLVAHEAREGRA
jgi:hypothetical protein